MKKTFLILSSLLVVVCCWGQTKTNNKHKSAVKNNADVRTIPLTKSEFLEKVANFEANQDEWKYLGDKPAIIDFHASWCGPCKVIAPILEELAAEYGDSIYVYKVDIDKEQEIATAFNIRARPVLLFVPMEGTPQMAQGAMSKDTIREAIEKVLLKKK